MYWNNKVTMTHTQKAYIYIYIILDCTLVFTVCRILSVSRKLRKTMEETEAHRCMFTAVIVYKINCSLGFTVYIGNGKSHNHMPFDTEYTTRTCCNGIHPYLYMCFMQIDTHTCTHNTHTCTTHAHTHTHTNLF